MTDLIHMGQAARAASRQLAVLSTAKKNAALLAIADALEAQAATVLAANAQDIAAGRAKGLSEALLDRLLLNEKRLAALAADTPPRRHAARPGRRGIRRPRAAQRDAAVQAAHPHRRHRRDLRGAAERHHRHRHPLPQDRQRRRSCAGAARRCTATWRSRK